MLNQEHTQFLLSLLDRRFKELLENRDRYKSEKMSSDIFILSKEVDESLASCLHLKSLLSVVTIDDSFVSGMLQREFDMIQNFITNHIRKLNKQLKALSLIDEDFSVDMKPAFEQRIAFIETIQECLYSMRGPAIVF